MAVTIHGDGLFTMPSLEVGNLNADLLDANNIVGSVHFFAFSTVPDGFLECNGQTVLRSTYAKLFAKIGTTYGAGDGTTTFHLPDARGMFLRGWDHGRGIDADRVLGSQQEDAFKSHTHFVYPSEKSGSVPESFDVEWRHGDSLANPKSTSSTGDMETRPKNLALLVCIKY